MELLFEQASNENLEIILHREQDISHLKEMQLFVKFLTR
jgi:hypothetical protein